MMRKLVGLGLIVFVYNLLFFPFIFPSFGRLDFLVFMTTILTSSWIAFAPSRQWGSKTHLSWRLTCLSLLLSFYALFRASPTDQTFLGCMSILLGCVSLYLLILTPNRYGGLIEYALVPLRLLKHYGLAVIQKYLLPTNTKSRITRPISQTTRAIIRGFLLTLPIALVVTAFLASSDPVFSQFVENTLKFLSPKQFILRGVHTVFLILALVPFVSLHIARSFNSPSRHPFWQKFHIEATVLVSAISIIMGIFLIIQFRYLFTTVAETSLHQFGVSTYSEYVRRGFIELLIVSSLVYATLGIGYVTIKSQAKINHLFLKITNYILLSELALFIISIARRVYLYQSYHGLTRIRIYGLAFVIIFFALTIVMFLRFTVKRYHPWHAYELGIGLVIVLATTLMRPDNLIATLYPPTVNHQVDHVHISRLSLDALPGWIVAFEHAQVVAQNLPRPEQASPDQIREIVYARDAVANLINHYTVLNKRYASPRGQLMTNLAEMAAYENSQSKMSLEDLNLLQANLTTFINTLYPDQVNVPFDRSYQSPLL